MAAHGSWRKDPEISWIRRSAASDAPSVRLICFPHAGGGASSFNGWRRLLPPQIDLLRVQLPGREDNVTRVPFSRINELIPELLPHLDPFLDRPFAFYGHSLGAIVAFEVTRELRRRRWPLPLCLFVSGRRAPQLPLSHPAYCLLPDEDFLAYLRVTGGTPEAILNKAHWRAKLFPTIRADLKISDLYIYRSEPPLRCRIFYFAGAEDRLVKSSEWRAWAAQTLAEFKMRVLQSGHFFRPDDLPVITGDIVDFLARKVGPDGFVGSQLSDAQLSPG